MDPQESKPDRGALNQKLVDEYRDDLLNVFYQWMDSVSGEYREEFDDLAADELDYKFDEIVSLFEPDNWEYEGRDDFWKYIFPVMKEVLDVIDKLRRRPADNYVLVWCEKPRKEIENV